MTNRLEHVDIFGLESRFRFGYYVHSLYCIGGGVADIAARLEPGHDVVVEGTCQAPANFTVKIDGK